MHSQPHTHRRPTMPRQPTPANLKSFAQSLPSAQLLPTPAPFLMSRVFGFLCSVPLRDYLDATAKAHNLNLSKFCRTALIEFQRHPKSFKSKDIGQRVLKNTQPSPRLATINVTIPPELRAWITDYADKQCTTISTIIRRATYEYARKLNNETKETKETKENPQLVIDAWLHFDGRGSDKIRQMEERRARTDPRRIGSVPVTKEDLKKIDVPWMRNPKRFAAERERMDELFKVQLHQYPEPTSRNPDGYDDWIVRSEW